MYWYIHAYIYSANLFFFLRITQEEFLETKIRSAFLQFIAEVTAEGKSFLYVVKYSTAVLVLKAWGVSALLVVTRDAQTGTAIALHEESSGQANSTGD